MTASPKPRISSLITRFEYSLITCNGAAGPFPQVLYIVRHRQVVKLRVVATVGTVHCTVQQCHIADGNVYSPLAIQPGLHKGPERTEPASLDYSAPPSESDRAAML
jgi:hypothetical protein